MKLRINPTLMFGNDKVLNRGKKCLEKDLKIISVIVLPPSLDYCARNKNHKTP